MDDMTLLREYAACNSEAAFAELVSRRIGFVYSAALRQVRDPHLAEDITQAVFIILAQKAGRISGKTILTGWFFRTIRFASLAQLRAAAKRSLRRATIEKEFQMQNEFQSPAADEIWNQISPLLDEALAELGEKDRQAVLLRFFENKSLAEVGSTLGMGEDTARKRVSRALEKLHRYFSKRGVTSTTATIAEKISTNSIQAAPVALAKTVTAVALAKGAAASASTLTIIKGALKIMAWTKMKMAAVVGAGVLLAAGTTTVLVKEFSPIDDKWFQTSSEVLNNAPANLKIIRRTHFGKLGMGGGMVGTPGRIVCVNIPLEREIMFAYNFSSDSSRMDLPQDFPKNGYDCLITLPHDRNAYMPHAGNYDGQDKIRSIMRDMIKKKFGLVARRETRDRDVLLLQVKNANAVGLQKTVQDPLAYSAIQSSIEGLNSKNFPINWLASELEGQLGIPVEDQTGLTNRIVLDLRWKKRPGETTLETIKRVVLDQLGLELVPSHEPIEMLIVEKVK